MKTLLIYIKHLILRIMKIAAKCPTCATYTNSVCVLYQGPYLSNLDIAPQTNLEEIIRIIDNKVQLKLGFTPENVANKSTNVLLGTSDILYPTQKAVKTYVDSSIAAISIPTLDEVLTEGNSSNKDIVLTGINGDVILDGNDAFVGNQPTLLIRNLLTSQNHRLLIDRTIYNNNGHQLDIIAPNLTQSQVLRYPKDSNYLVTKVNGVAANDGGEITLPPTSIPTLQQVTDAGNTTTTGILVADSGNVDRVELTPGNVKVYYDPSGEFIKIDKNTITFDNDGGFVKNLKQGTAGSPATHNLNLPEVSGNLAVSVNGNAANANGNITIPYPNRVYVAEISMVDGSVINLLKNTLGDTLLWAVLSPGTISALSAVLAGETNNFISVTSKSNVPKIVSADINVSSLFWGASIHQTDNAGAPNNTGSVFVEIRVY